MDDRPTLQCKNSSEGLITTPTQNPTADHLSPELANLFLAGLPEKNRVALETRAQAMNHPVWAIVEMAFTKCLYQRIAGYLDEEALSSMDCQPRLD
jgi:hypothetical protein